MSNRMNVILTTLTSTICVLICWAPRYHLEVLLNTLRALAVPTSQYHAVCTTGTPLEDSLYLLQFMTSYN